MKPPSDPAYIGAPDTTFAGSRNAFSAMILWDHFAHLSYDDQIKTAVRVQEVVEYGVQQLSKLSKTLGDRYGAKQAGGRQKTDDWLWVSHTPSALTIRFRKPDDHIVKKFSLSGESMYVNVDGRKLQRNFAHIYIMDHLTHEKLDHLVHELEKEEAWHNCHDTEIDNSEQQEHAHKHHKTDDGKSHHKTGNLKENSLRHYHAGSRGY